MTTLACAFRGGLLVLAASLSVAACGAEGPTPASASHAYALPEVDGPLSPGWAPTPTDEDPTVATVGGVPILLSQLQQVVDADGGATAPTVLLERLVEAELLGQAALERGYYRADVVGPVFRAAMVEELLARELIRPAPASFFTEDMLRDIYYQPIVRVKFDHVDLFKVVDAQITCCARRYDQCHQAEFEACMTEEEPNARQLHELLRAGTRDRASFNDTIQEAAGRNRRLAVRVYSFFYNVNLPHDEQRDHNVVNENVARATLGLEVGQFSEPVRSRNAWHIIYLAEHVPEEHRTIADPEVRGEIISRVFDKVREARFAERLVALHAAHGVEVFPDVLNELYHGMKKGAAVGTGGGGQ